MKAVNGTLTLHLQPGTLYRNKVLKKLLLLYHRLHKLNNVVVSGGGMSCLDVNLVRCCSKVSICGVVSAKCGVMEDMSLKHSLCICVWVRK